MQTAVATAGPEGEPEMSQTESRRLPRPPEADARLPLLIDTDVGTEIDDQYAIALALCCPDRFDLVGIAGCYFHDEPDSPAECVRQARNLLELAGRPDACPVARGCDPLSWTDRPMDGEAVELIIESARGRDPENPLWIVALGPLSNVASAWLRKPEISEQVVLVFHSRSRHWDLKFSSYNAIQDLRAARAVMRSRLPLVLFDAGTYLTMGAEETERRLASSGRLGAYLHDYRSKKKGYASPLKGFFDLADIAWLCEPEIGEWQTVPVPEIRPDLTLSFDRPCGRCLRVHQIDNRRARELFYRRLAAAAGGSA